MGKNATLSCVGATLNLADLQTFIVVAEEGTFAAAGRRLKVPKSTVSRRVARLEADLDVALLQRSSRSFALTDDGRALVDRCGPALREIADVERGFGDAPAKLRGELRISAPIDIGITAFVTGLIAEFAVANEFVCVDFDITNRVVDILEEGYDCVFRTHVGPLPDRDDLAARLLGPLPMSVFASPGYLATRGPVTSWEDLSNHVVACHVGSHRARWPKAVSVVSNDYGPLAAILAAGGGVGATPDFVAAPYVERGELQKLDLSYEVPEARLSLVWLRSRHLAPRVRAFIDLAASRAPSSPWLASAT